MLSALSSASSHGFLPLFQAEYDKHKIGELIDTVHHRRHGEASLDPGVVGLELGAGFEMQREMLSLRATTHWELATVHAR